jgi:hypothetical protein
MRQQWLGDVRAEHDRGMLDAAFYESADYRTLIESDVKSIVVGRRGTGKSALYLRLADYYRSGEKTDVIVLSPDEHDMLGLRPLAELFGGQFKLTRAAMRIAFRYAFSMELANVLSTRYKFAKSDSSDFLNKHLVPWRAANSMFATLRNVMREVSNEESSFEGRVSRLYEVLEVQRVEVALRETLTAMKRNAVFLVDRTDEGYEPDEKGVGIIDGLTQALIDLRDHIPSVRSIIFLRDNIYRSVQQKDQDFSRNLEQSVLRLHWDENALLNLVANRLRLAFNLRAEKSLRVWDSVTQEGLQGESGFQQCLRLTLYRPRDLLLLLNEAFRRARALHRHAIIPTDINDSARSISENRLADLVKEYESQVPGLPKLVAQFSNNSPVLSVQEAAIEVDLVTSTDEYEARVQQDMMLLSDPVEALRMLYSVGFLGVRDAASGYFIFCHDGRKPDKDLLMDGQLLVHPCYWMALNLTSTGVDENSTSEIYDEYEVTVKSETPEARVRMIGLLEAELRDIEEGDAGWSEFEQWCLKVIRVLCATGLRNVQLNGNKDNLQRRDVIGTNHGETIFWKRVLESYGSRQVLFECKNFRELKREHYWQINSYLSKDYGSIAFFITRDDDINLQRDRELAWTRELRNEHQKVVIKLTAKYLIKILGKLRSPAKHNAADQAFDSLLDTYVRNYFGESARAHKTRR